MSKRLLSNCVSAVRISLTTFQSNTVFQKRAMAAWASEKNRILNLPLDKKRALYAKNSFIGLDGIKTWKEIAETQTSSDDTTKPSIDKSWNNAICNKISIYEGDITQLEIDAIVNAANSRLAGGGGVDGAIHRAAGSLLKDECLTLGGCPTGDAKLTGGYNLPAKYVIHTVGPQDKSAEKLTSCYEKCLSIVRENGFKSVAFPCISTGIYGYPNEAAAHVACSVVRKFLEDDCKNHKGSINRVIFCVFLKTDLDIYQNLCHLYFPC